MANPHDDPLAARVGGALIEALRAAGLSIVEDRPPTWTITGFRDYRASVGPFAHLFGPSPWRPSRCLSCGCVGFHQSDCVTRPRPTQRAAGV